jgi:hypothetical protein
MSANSALVLVLLLGSLAAPASAYAQLTPPAGSAGAGNSPINGIPVRTVSAGTISIPHGCRSSIRCPTIWRFAVPIDRHARTFARK